MKIFNKENRKDAEQYEGQIFWCGNTIRQLQEEQKTGDQERKRTLSGTFDKSPYFRMKFGFYFNFIGIDDPIPKEIEK